MGDISYNLLSLASDIVTPLKRLMCIVCIKNVLQLGGLSHCWCELPKRLRFGYLRKTDFILEQSLEQYGVYSFTR